MNKSKNPMNHFENRPTFFIVLPLPFSRCRPSRIVMPPVPTTILSYRREGKGGLAARRRPDFVERRHRIESEDSLSREREGNSLNDLYSTGNFYRTSVIMSRVSAPMRLPSVGLQPRICPGPYLSGNDASQKNMNPKEKREAIISRCPDQTVPL